MDYSLALWAKFQLLDTFICGKQPVVRFSLYFAVNVRSICVIFLMLGKMIG